MEDPKKNLFINHLVCEGCGDCSVESNCISVEPLKTEYGIKRKINQSTCNKDYSCANGFCPSFTIIEGASISKKSFAKPNTLLKKIPNPPTFKLKNNTYNILVTGIGGTGVVTIGALIGMAAHIEKKGVSVLDQVGIAQKGGAVLSHIKIAERPSSIYSPNLINNSADLLLGCDMVVSASNDVQLLLNRKKTISIVNDHETPLSQSVLDPNFSYNSSIAKKLIKNNSIEIQLINASELSRQLFGDTILSNTFLVGYAIQKGLLPISLKAIKEAIKLNGISIEENLNALYWGRLSANDIKYVIQENKLLNINIKKTKTLDQLISERYQDLVTYHNKAYAEKFYKIINSVKLKDKNFKNNDMLSKATVKSLYRIMAYKDEFEVARLYTDGRFEKSLNDTFNGKYKMSILLSPPILNLIDKKTKKPKKIVFSKKIFFLFKLLKKFKFLRNTILNPFGYSLERRKEKKLIKKFEECISIVFKEISEQNYRDCVNIITLFDEVRGYGHIKMRNFKYFEDRLEENLKKLSNKTKNKKLAAE